MERVLCDLFAEILGRESVGLDDDFFAMGGHSLLAARLIGCLYARFHVDLCFRSVLEAPTVRQLAERILRGPTFQAAPARSPIPRTTSSGPSSPSLSQERFWIEAQLDPKSPAYHVPLALRLRGALDRDALALSLDALVERHDVLRTTFGQEAGNPVQWNCSDRRVPLLEIDLRDVSQCEQDVRISRLLTSEARRAFDLTQDLMLRATLLRPGDQDHVLLLVFPHIVFDGWSLNILWRELTELYRGFASGRPSPLRPLPVRYADYAAWHRQWLDSEVVREQLAYWKERLGDRPAALQLPTDRPRPATPSGRGAVRRACLTGRLRSALTALSRDEGATLFMTMLAAFQALLHRYTEQTDVSVGAPIAGRGRTETEGLIGCFINTLVLRTDLAGDPSFRKLLERVRETCLGAFAHQDVPFERLVKEIRPGRNSAPYPFFSVMFVLQNTPREASSWHGLQASPLEVSLGTARFDWILGVEETSDGLALELEYSTDLFDDATAGRVLDHYRVMLEGIVADPGRRLSELPLLTGTERRLVLESWTDTSAEFPKDQCVHELFAAQALRTPDALAIIDGDRAWTYAALDERAERMARALRARGIGPDVPVAVLMDRSADAVAAFLGVLKAGGAYVPLDPAYPAARVRAMLEDCRAPVVLTDSEHRGRVPAGHEVALMDVQSKETHLTDDVARPLRRPTAENLAYVMYTSGSTGGPKGIAVPHRAVTRLVLDTDYVQFDPTDRVAHASNISFDAATFEIWGALLNGASLIVVPIDVLLAPRRLAAMIREQGITTAFLTTSLFNQYASDLPRAFEPLRHLIVGGEALDPVSVRTVLESGPPRRLTNAYGPTESTTFASCHDVFDVPRDAATVPIGRPITNTTAYVLDRWHRPVPIGVPGELYLGGDGLARGYLGRPELTAERFVADPWSLQTGARLYRTGDRARWRADGTLDFLGRLDGQVKLRGFRIEPGEIEAALRRQPGVARAAVVVREDDAKDRCLVGYVVRLPGVAITTEGLRDALRNELPKYMQPSAIVVVEDLPLTPNGKLDRAALPPPAYAMSRDERECARPRSPLESSLANIWCEVLRLPEVGVRDNFFALGGHSLAALRVLGLVRDRLGRTLAPTAFFLEPTIEAIAKQISAPNRAHLADRALVPLQPKGTRCPFFCVHGIGGEVQNLRPLARSLGQDQPFYGLRACCWNGADSGPTIEGLAAAYLSEIRSVLQPGQPFLIGGYSLGGVIAFEMARQLSESGERVALLAIIDSTLPNLPGLQRRSRVGLVRDVLRNLPPWLFHHARGSDPRKLLTRSARKIARAVRRPAVSSPTVGQEPLELDVQSMFGVATLPEELRVRAAALYRARVHYEPRPFAGRLTLFRPAARPLLELANPTLGWERFARGGVDVHAVPGSHESCIRDPHVLRLARALQHCLRGVQSQGQSQ
jgi:amino acid adenylation domain-containing protein